MRLERHGLYAIIEPPRQETTVPIPQPLPRPITYVRFEIKDKYGNFIPGAAVTVSLDDGRHILTKLSDVGGNVSFSPAELSEVAERMVPMPRGDATSVFVVRAPGKKEVTGTFFDPRRDLKEQVGIREIILVNETEAEAPAMWPYLLVGAAVIGGIAYALRPK